MLQTLFRAFTRDHITLIKKCLVCILSPNAKINIYIVVYQYAMCISLSVIFNEQCYPLYYTIYPFVLQPQSVQLQYKRVTLPPSPPHLTSRHAAINQVKTQF